MENSTLDGMTCASAISATSRGAFVVSADQSLKVERNPCVVMSFFLMCRRAMSILMLESGINGRNEGTQNAAGRIGRASLVLGLSKRQQH